MLENEYLEECVPILALISSRLVSNPEWSLKLLDATTRKLLLPMYRQERDTAVDLSRAIEAGHEVVRRCPNGADDLVVLAHLLARAERLEESLKWVDQAIALESGNAGYHRLRASVLERLGRFVEAEATITDAVALLPASLELQEDRRRIAAGVLAWYRQERDTAVDLSRAIEAGHEVVRRCPNGADDLVVLAHLLARAERLEESLKWVDQAIALESGNAGYHRLRASVLERLGHYFNARSAAITALSLVPKKSNVAIDIAKDIRRIRNKYLLRRIGLLRLITKFCGNESCNRV